MTNAVADRAMQGQGNDVRDSDRGFRVAYSGLGADASTTVTGTEGDR